MPKSETSNPNDGPSFQAPRYRPNWIAAIVCLMLGTYLLVAIAAYDPVQSRHISTAPSEKNPVGWVGAETVWYMLSSFGAAAWLLPIFLFWSVYAAARNPRLLCTSRVIAMLFAAVALAAIAAMFRDVGWKSNYFPQGPGGLVGLVIYHRALADALGGFGSGLLLGTVYCLSLVFIVTKDVGAEVEKIFASFRAWRAERARRKAEHAAQRQKEKDGKAKQMTAVAAVTANIAAANAQQQTVGPTGKKTFVPKTAEDPLAKGVTRPALAPDSAGEKPGVADQPPKPETKTAPALKLGAAKPAAAEPAVDPKKPLPVPVIFKPATTAKAATTELPADENYKRFPLSLLKEQVRPPEDSDEEHMRNIADLVRILGEFGVEVTPGEIHVGPVITCYEVVPAAGVRVEKISGLDKNIALGMKAQSVRILAPIPGKAAVGVEIPNRQPTPVGMREILESQDWRDVRAEIPIALGKDVSGLPLISDLTRMPHLLIAGATGSGKSVCINSIIASIVYRRGPRDVRLIMVDPKVVELKIFNVLPHMLIPVVTEPKKVPGALKWLLSEMEQRYQQFAKVGVRNITGFNNRKKSADPVPAAAEQTSLALQRDDDLPLPDHLHYIVAIIDELADLMMVAPAEIETSIARLAQLARAAGIHLIIATQRPSVNVITGVIKANLPSRIAFQVASQVDSRTILDTKGADTLIGRGDMLFSPPGTSRLVRAQGAFMSDDEVHEMVKYLKENNQPPVYAQEVQAHIDRVAKEDDEEAEGGDDGDLGDDEELYQQALDVLKSTRRASTSMLQRRLRIGYNRAARVMEIMEEKGIVGPENGSSPREILVDLDTL
jgi:S-DNA-T family DNA segregation ATPase FtsK/SpoIIIE